MKIDEKEAIKTVIDHYNETINSTYRKKRVDDWEKWEKAYRGKRIPTDFPFPSCSNIDLGIIQIHTDAIASRLKLAIIGAEPMFQMTSDTENPEILKLKEDAMTTLCKTNLTGQIGKAGIEPITDAIVHNLAVYGSCIAKNRWQTTTKYRKIFPKNPFLGAEPAIISEEKERQRIDIIALEDFLIPDDITNIQEATYCIHRLYLSKSELKARKKVYQNVEKVLDWLDKEKGEKTAVEKVVEKGEEFSTERVEVLEWYGQIEVDGEMQECILTVAKDSEILLRKSLLIDVYWNNERPFHRFALEDIGSFYGLGIPEKLGSNAEALNDIYNTSMNMGYYQMMGCGFYDKNANIDDEKFEISPGVLNPIDGDPNRAVMLIPYPAQAQIGQSFIGLLNNFIERKTAISAPSQGVELPTKRTATEIKSLIDEGSIRHQDTIQSLRTDFGLFLKSIYELYQLNIPDSLLLQISGGKLSGMFC